MNAIRSGLLAAALLLLVAPPLLAASGQSFGAINLIDTAIDQPSDLAAADFDNDGDTDLASADFGSGTIALYINDGAGSFYKLPIATGVSGASLLQFADMNGDGYPDLLTGASASGILLFSYLDDEIQQTTVSDLTGVTGMVSGDFDGDGDLDVAASSIAASGTIRWFEQTPSGYLAHNIVVGLPNTRSLQVADVDGDGSLDLVASSTAQSGTLLLCLNDGGGVFSPFVLDSAVGYLSSLGCADIDGDSDLDIVGTVQDSGQLLWWEQQALAEFQPHEIVGDFIGVNSLALGDLNGDLAPDIVAGSASASSVRVWINEDGSLVEGAPLIGLQSPGALRIVPVDGDDVPDVLAASDVDGLIGWWRQEPNLEFAPHVIAAELSGVSRIQLADINGDDLPDLLAGAAELLGWYQRDGNGYTPQLVALIDATGEVIHADLDGDGDIDVAAGNPGDQAIYWFEQQSGGTYLQHPLDENTPEPFGLGSADVDGDGDIDLISCGGIHVSWYENHGDGEFQEHIIAQLDGASTLAVGDLIGNGWPDLVVASHTADEITIFRNQTGGQFSELTVTASIEDCHFLSLADFDLDGDLDIAASSTSTGAVYIYRNQPTGFLRRTVSVDLLQPTGLAAGDLDGDGDTDLAVAETGANRLRWFDNNGVGLFAGKLVAGDLTGVIDVKIADGDADGDLDVFASVPGLASAYWFENLSDLNLPLASLQLAPFNPPVSVPHDGGSFFFDLTITNLLAQPTLVQVWAQAMLPNGQTVVLPPAYPLQLEPGLARTFNFVEQAVPEYAPPGDYVYRVNLGSFPGFAYTFDEFAFTKQYGPILGGARGSARVTPWTAPDFDRERAAFNSSADELRAPVLSAASPNPFNAATTLTLRLPESSEVRVEVVNVHGQRVAVLADGRLPAGQHRLGFDANHLASGVYFVRLAAASQPAQVRKLLLLR